MMNRKSLILIYLVFCFIPSCSWIKSLVVPESYLRYNIVDVHLQFCGYIQDSIFICEEFNRLQDSIAADSILTIRFRFGIIPDFNSRIDDPELNFSQCLSDSLESMKLMIPDRDKSGEHWVDITDALLGAMRIDYTLVEDFVDSLNSCNKAFRGRILSKGIYFTIPLSIIVSDSQVVLKTVLTFSGDGREQVEQVRRFYLKQ